MKERDSVAGADADGEDNPDHIAGMWSAVVRGVTPHTGRAV